MVTERVKLQNPERFAKPHTIPREKLEAAVKKACDKLEAYAKTHDMTKFPGTRSINFKYELHGIDDPTEWWEAGMYTGTYLLAYQLTGKEIFREVVEAQLETYRPRFDRRIGVNGHDVGFIHVPSCVAAYKVLGRKDMRDFALEVLDFYYDNAYSKEGRFIIRSGKRGWNSPAGCRTMMDSMMNASFLFWGGVEMNNPELTLAARDHTKTTETYLIRPDGSSFHHFQFNPEDASPVKGVTLQGNSDDSCWSRGHSWGIYGFPIAYSYCHEDFQKEIHKDITYFMLNHLPEDLIPCWDYDFIKPTDPRDASAAAIAVCGMHEMCKFLTDADEQKAIFESAGAQMLESLIDNYTGDIGVEYDGLIHHVTHALPQGQGIDECAVYGDYFYLEALMRYLNPTWEKYW